MRGEKVPPERKEMVTMHFSDVVGFTAISAGLPAEKVRPAAQGSGRTKHTTIHKHADGQRLLALSWILPSSRYREYPTSERTLPTR